MSPVNIVSLVFVGEELIHNFVLFCSSVSFTGLNFISIRFEFHFDFCSFAHFDSVQV